MGKNQLMDKEKKAKREDLRELFDSQMETLKQRGCPEKIIESLANKKSEVIAKEKEIWEADYPNETLDTLANKGIYLGIPVIPRSVVDVDTPMKMVRYSGKKGRICLDQSKLSDVVVGVPDKPYFIFDVEDGKAMLGKSPEKAEKLVEEQKRSCLIVEEGIAVCIHTKVFFEHNMSCTGSRYEGDRVPVIYLDDDELLLFSSYAVYWNYRWGSASCGSRL